MSNSCPICRTHGDSSARRAYEIGRGSLWLLRHHPDPLFVKDWICLKRQKRCAVKKRTQKHQLNLLHLLHQLLFQDQCMLLQHQQKKQNHNPNQQHHTMSPLRHLVLKNLQQNPQKYLVVLLVWSWVR